MRSIIWFRNDLRLADNHAVRSALEQGQDGCIAIYLIEPNTWKHHGLGSPRITFALKCLEDLAPDLEQLGIPLLIRSIANDDDAIASIQSIAQEHHCSSIHVNREHGVDEIKRDALALKAFSKLGIAFHIHDSNTILPVHEIRTQGGLPYSVFTPFSRSWYRMLNEVGLQSNTELSAVSRLDVASDPVPGDIPGFPLWSEIERWPAGEQTAHNRLDAFLNESVQRYHDKRDCPGTPSTSTLSPWLAAGALSPITAMRALFDRYGDVPDQWPQGVKSWANELVWREFYRHVMIGFPKVSMNLPMQDWTRSIPWREDPEGLEAWQDGRTGIDIVDAGMMQLKQIGWMHNRVRMITSMFLSKNLLIHWRHGESHFARHLVDYDFASNNGGWQWAASTGCDAAPYFRIFNPQRQAETWDLDGNYVRTWLDRPPMSLKPIVDLGSSRRRAIDTFREAKESWQGSSQDSSKTASIGSD